MLQKNTFQYHVNIRIHDEYVDFQLEDSKFSFDLNQNGLPLFPKWVKNKLPAFVPGTLEKMMIQMRKETAWKANFYLDVEHAPACAEELHEYRRFGIPIICGCNPVLHEPKIRDYLTGGENSKLTCAVCDESTTGKLGGSYGFEEWETWGVYKGDRRIRDYWRFSGDYNRYICDDCFRTFPNYTYDVFASTPDLKSLKRKQPQSQSGQEQESTETSQIESLGKLNQRLGGGTS